MRPIFALLLLLAPSLQQNASGPDPSIVISSIQVSTSPLFVSKPKNKTKPVAGPVGTSARTQRGVDGHLGSPSEHFQSFLPSQFVPPFRSTLLDETTAPEIIPSANLGNSPLKSAYYFAGLLPGAAAPATRPMCQLAPPVCDPSARYRTIDGSCNNLRNPTWGMTGSLFNRLIPAKYADGIARPVEEGLPLARVLSATLFPDVNLVDPIWTLISMQWSQVITHDMSMAAGSRQHKPKPIECCASDGHDLARDLAAKAGCFPIRIPAEDPFYGVHNQRCMDFMRSSNDVSTGCNTFGPANQMTAVTSYLDLSLVYGSNADTMQDLREFRGGRMIAERRQGREWLPESTNRSADCENVDANEPCYRSGDVRVNQNPGQALVQTLLLREHNRLADALQHLNPNWNDETVFQEARRIAIAEYQHITYYEWLPILLGYQNTVNMGLVQEHGGFSSDYEEQTDATAVNDHAAGAFRHLHTLITGEILEIDPHRRAVDAIRLSDYFNRPVIIERGTNLDHFVRGLATQPQHAPDRFFTAEITKFLFRANKPFGMDLRSIDIQRGRDHGLPSYNDYRALCGLPKAASFADFADVMDAESAEALGHLYNSPDDVDMIVGGGLEQNVPGALAGPTMLCVMGEQFRRTKRGDRFWFELSGQSSSFTHEQLAEIRKSSLARIFCDNSDHVDEMQHYTFKKPSDTNPLLPCEQLPAMDLSFWKEQPTVTHPAQQAHGPFSFFNYIPSLFAGK